MSRKLTPSSTLENLRREAKRWLKALRAYDAAARARLERVWPDAPHEPTLRDVQHALAREHGSSGWVALTHELAAIAAQRSGDGREHAVEQLLLAAVAGDAAGVASLLDRHPDIVNERALIPGHTGLRTALHHAVAHEPVVRLLLERGADPNIRDDGDNAMPLHFAAEREDLTVIRLLIEHGADPIGASNHHELTVIGWATCFGTGRRDVVDYLLEHGARHEIFSAVAVGDTAAIRALAAQSRAEIDRYMDETNHRRRPLHLAVVKRQPAALAVLLELGADTEAEDNAGLTALDEAALSGADDMVELLIDHGARLRLPAAVALGRSADVASALRNDPDGLKPGNRWGTLIVRAGEQARGNVIESLILAGASVDVRDSTTTSVDGTAGYTPLHAAAFRGNADAVAVLLKHGANPNVRDSKYYGTPAGWADYAGHQDVRDQILRARIDPFQAIDFDLPDRIPGIVQQSPWSLNRRFREYIDFEPAAGERNPEPWHTPLVWAVVTGKVEAVRALLEQGATQPLSPDGRTPLQLALAAGHAEIAELLRQHQRVDQTHDGRVRWFVKHACPDHDIRGPWHHAMAVHTAERMLRQHPEIAHDSFYTAVICGDYDAVARALAERPELARERGGPKRWEPLLYLCFARLPFLSAATDNAVAIATLLLDHDADPNAYFMAGSSRYTPLVGVIGEGEEDRPPHPQRDALARLLLERGAHPYDMQVGYNIHFHGNVLWWLELIYEHSVRQGRLADWQDPDWQMLHEGGYGCGARYYLWIALERNDLTLAEWLLAHGASANAPPAPHPNWPKASLHELALQRGQTAMAELLVRYGATPAAATVAHVDPTAEFVAASLRLDRGEIQRLLGEHPELLQSPKAIITAAEQNRADVVEFLLDVGVPIEVENDKHQRPLHAAAWSDAIDVAQLLIDRGAAIDPVETDYHNTPLDFAVYAHHRRMMALLSRYSHELWNITFVGNVARVRELLREEPERAKLVSEQNETPLMWLPDDEAAAVELVRLYLEYGADPSIRDHNGMTAADHASRRGLREAAELLRPTRVRAERRLSSSA
jgi:ankyrin repeat protein